MKEKKQKDLKGKYEIVLKHENAWAASVAHTLKKSRPFTVWEVLLPVFLIFNWARGRVDRDIFCQNLLFTKKMALHAAMDIIKNERSTEAARASAEDETRALLETTQNGIYSESIRQRQLQEVDLLTDHYRKLLEAEGDRFERLVRHGYGGRAAYLDFLTTLADIEAKVSQAALETVGPKGDPEFVAKMAEASRRYRMKTVQKIFEEGGHG